MFVFILSYTCWLAFYVFFHMLFYCFELFLPTENDDDDDYDYDYYYYDYYAQKKCMSPLSLNPERNAPKDAHGFSGIFGQSFLNQVQHRKRMRLQRHGSRLKR